MATATTTRELQKLLGQLQAERSGHEKAIADIDETFQQFGITPQPRKRRGRPPGRPKGSTKKATKKSGRRKRRKFSQTGDESVISFVKSKGSATTKEINGHWSKEGRGGKADNSLTNLVKAGELKRKNIKGARGSVYTAK